jgi:hypothetical protein
MDVDESVNASVALNCAQENARTVAGKGDHTKE